MVSKIFCAGDLLYTTYQNVFEWTGINSSFYLTAALYPVINIFNNNNNNFLFMISTEGDP